MRVIETALGKVRGIRRDGCDEYLSIPFAKPPVGELRFRHPRPAEPWEGILDGTRGSCNPVQSASDFGTGNNSEDCLYLNVFVPDAEEGTGEEEKKRPVLVWIYGGSYALGGAGAVSEDEDRLNYELGALAKATDTVVVSLNYRLNLYGFLYLTWLSDRFEANCGLYDLKMGLGFVHDNIGAFGGDAANVTVFGQSAGGALILALLSDPGALELFQKALVMSACAEHFFTKSEAEKTARRYLKHLGVSCKDPEGVLAASHDAVRRANRKLANELLYLRGELRCPFSPVIDGVLPADEPKKLARRSDKPLLIGYTSREADTFTTAPPAAVLPAAAVVMKIRPAKELGTFRKRFSDGLTEHIYKRPAREIAGRYDGPVWLYEFAYTPEVLRKKGMGPCHVSDIAVLFAWTNELNDAADPESVRVREKQEELIGAFVRDEMTARSYREGHAMILIR